MSGRSYKTILLTLALLLLGGVSFIQRDLNRQRTDPALGLTRTASLDNAPPVLAFTTVALGGFRGLIANALWIRATDLQDAGQYFEMVQLADWITKLEPHFAQVWKVQAWNMAYNISVKFSDDTDRWRWVQRGIELLRDEGLRYNPTDALMYQELGWFFQHKMGQSLDTSHSFYKKSWSEEMTAVLGGGRPNFAELISPQTEEARQRVARLREKYKMDPAFLKEVDDNFGPLEWRLPEAHAIYWAALGLKKAGKRDEITLRRIIYQSMHASVLYGRVYAIRNNGYLRVGPNFDLIPRTIATYEHMMREDQEEAYKVTSSYRNFCREIVYLLYTHNRQKDSAQWFKYLKEKFPDAVPADLSLKDYALQRIFGLQEDLNPNRIGVIVRGYLVNHYVALAQDEDDVAANYDQLATLVWNRFLDRYRTERLRLRMPTLQELREDTLAELLHPEFGLQPALQARLRTRLNLPAPTNAPPATGGPAVKK